MAIPRDRRISRRKLGADVSLVVALVLRPRGEGVRGKSFPPIKSILAFDESTSTDVELLPM